MFWVFAIFYFLSGVLGLSYLSQLSASNPSRTMDYMNVPPTSKKVISPSLGTSLFVYFLFWPLVIWYMNKIYYDQKFFDKLIERREKDKKANNEKEKKDNEN
jgi:hypothetical protein